MVLCKFFIKQQVFTYLLDTATWCFWPLVEWIRNESDCMTATSCSLFLESILNYTCVFDVKVFFTTANGFPFNGHRMSKADELQEDLVTTSPNQLMLVALFDFEREPCMKYFFITANKSSFAGHKTFIHPREPNGFHRSVKALTSHRLQYTNNIILDFGREKLAQCF